MTTTVYICADGTLTYGPLGGLKKIIPQALPIGTVDSPEHAERLIALIGRKAYNVPEADPDFRQATKGKPIPKGYGPSHRYYYSLPEFKYNDVDSIFAVRDRMEADLIERART